MTWQEKFYNQFESSLSSQGGLELVRFAEGTGLSIVEDYPANYKRLMRVPKNSAFKAMYKFAVKEGSDNNEYMPLFISAGLTLEENEDGRKRYLLSYGKIKGITPVDFTSKDDFYVHKTSGKLYEKINDKYTRLSYFDLFKRMQRTHLSKLTDARAVILRLRIFITRKIPSTFLFVIAFLGGLLTWIIEGKRFQYDVVEESIRDGFEPERTEKATESPKEQIDFFGYKVPIWTLFTFSILTIISAILSTSYDMPYYDDMVKSPGPLLSIAVSLVAIVFYDKIAPFLLKKLVKTFALNAYNLKYKGSKLKI